MLLRWSAEPIDDMMPIADSYGSEQDIYAARRHYASHFRRQLRRVISASFRLYHIYRESASHFSAAVCYYEYFLSRVSRYQYAQDSRVRLRLMLLHEYGTALLHHTLDICKILLQNTRASPSS